MQIFNNLNSYTLLSIISEIIQIRRHGSGYIMLPMGPSKSIINKETEQWRTVKTSLCQWRISGGGGGGGDRRRRNLCSSYVWWPFYKDHVRYVGSWLPSSPPPPIIR